MSWYNPLSWGEDDASSDASEYLKKMEDMLYEQYKPYQEYGMRAMPTLEEQYALLVNNPAYVQAMLGSGYTQSPGYEYQYDQAMNSINAANAAGGGLGTSAHQQQAGKTATGLANQDYWNYYNQNAALYNTGLQGTLGQFNTGYNATNQLTSGLGSVYGNQANLAYATGQSQNNMLGSAAGGLLGAGSSFGWW